MAPSNEAMHRLATAGVLSDRRKSGLVEDATNAVLAAAGLENDVALRVWVLVHEQADGSWGAGGQIIRYADLLALAGSPSGQP
jgi:phenylpyruvate tautomerase PptA (4-oxalocrotonate tautomerase family)